MNVENIDIQEEIALLEQLNIESFKNDALQVLTIMDKNSIEYVQLRDLLLGDENTNKSKFLGKLAQYTKEFSQGLLVEFMIKWISGQM